MKYITSPRREQPRRVLRGCDSPVLCLASLCFAHTVSLLKMICFYYPSLSTHQKRDMQRVDWQSKTKITSPSEDTSDFQKMFSVNSLLITPRKRDEEQAEYQSKAKISGPSGDTSDFQIMFSVNSLLITPRKRDEELAECQSKTKISGPSGDTSDFQKMFSVNSLLITPPSKRGLGVLVS